MTPVTKYIKGAAFFIVLVTLISSCRKEQPACKGNCISLAINGATYVQTNGAALANVAVEVNWFIKAYCIGCTSYKVVAGKTGNDGKFNFNVTIDSTFFKDYFLSVRVPTDSNFITVPGDGGVLFNEVRFYDYNANDLQNLKFASYPKTYLTIKLHRTLADTFNYFSVDHNFTSAFGYGDLNIGGPQFAVDTTLKVETCADIYTRIAWKKVIIGGQTDEHTDSLVCTKNGANVFNINY